MAKAQKPVKTMSEFQRRNFPKATKAAKASQEAPEETPEAAPANDPLKPSIKLLITLGSLAVHIEEFLSAKGHAVDRDAINTLLRDEELKAWVAKMTKMAFLPVKR